MDKKTVIITGAGRGIGSGISSEFAKAGYNIVVNYSRSEDAANKVCVEAKTHGADTLLVKADVSKMEDCAKLVDETISRFGKIDVLVNNAGVDGLVMPIWDYTEEEFDRVMKINVFGQFYMMKYASKHMIKNETGGSIINISSFLETLGSPAMAGYVTSKAAIGGLVKTAALDLGIYNINVNAIAPGVFDTDMTKDMPQEYRDSLANQAALKRIGQPWEIGTLAVYLSSEGAKFITGKTITIDGYCKI